MTYSFQKNEEFLNDLQYRIGQVITLVEESIAKLPPESLAGKPKDGKWSILQQLFHAQLLGSDYLKKLEKAYQKVNDKTKSPTFHIEHTAVGLKWINALKQNEEGMIKPQKTKLKYLPKERKMPENVIEQFLNTQKEFSAMLKKAALIDIQNTKLRIKGIFSPKVNFGDVLAIFVLHTERHIHRSLKQMKMMR